MVERTQKTRNKFTSPREAGKLVGYTSDYVTRLAREGKIASKRDGRRWLIELDSLKLFALEVAALKQKRRVQLSEERRVEKLAKATVAFDAVKAVEDPRKKKNAFVQATITAAFLLAVMSVPASPFIINQLDTQASLELSAVIPDDVSSQEAFALKPVLDWVADALTFKKVTKVEMTDAVADAQMSDEQERDNIIRSRATVQIPSVHSKSGIIVVSDTGLGEDAATVVQDAFSDETSVIFETANSGVIIPHFERRNGSPHQFVLVDDVLDEHN